MHNISIVHEFTCYHLISHLGCKAFTRCTCYHLISYLGAKLLRGERTKITWKNYHCQRRRVITDHITVFPYFRMIYSHHKEASLCPFNPHVYYEQMLGYGIVNNLLLDLSLLDRCRFIYISLLGPI